MFILTTVSQYVVGAVPKGSPLPLLFKPDLVVQ